MRITFNTSTTETVEYLRLMSQVLRNNSAVEERVQAYQALKAAVESIGARLDKLEDERRNKVCR